VKRKDKKKKFRPLRLIMAALLSAAAAAAVLSLPVWRISNVEVRGSSIIPAELIKQKANISFNENIFFVNYAELERRVKGIPQIKSARAFAKVPSTVMIAVEERRPFSVFIVGGDYIVADDEGVIIDMIKSGEHRPQTMAEVSKLPTVIGLPGDAVESSLRIRPGVMKAIERSFRMLNEHFKESRFSLIMKDAGDISILIDDTLKVKIGSPDNIDDKLSNLSAIIKDRGGSAQNIEYIDVRVPDAPAVRFKR